MPDEIPLPPIAKGASRRRLPPTPTEPLTIESLLDYVRRVFNALQADINDIRTLALAQGERRTEDLRKMIAEEVESRMEAKMQALLAEMHAIIDPLVTSHEDEKDLLEFVRAEKASRELRENVAELRRDRLDGLFTDLRVSVMGLAGLILAGKAQTQWGLPWWIFWPLAVTIGLTCIIWPFYRNLIRPRRRSTDGQQGSATQQGGSKT